MEFEELFTVKIKTPLEGELPTDYFRDVLERVEKAFHKALGRDPRGRKKDLRILARVEKGSTELQFRTGNLDGESMPEGASAWPFIHAALSNVNKLPEEEPRTETEYAVIRQFLDLGRKISQYYPLEIGVGTGKTDLPIDKNWVRKAATITYQKTAEKETALWGKLMEGDFREDKYSCKLVFLDGREIQCTYPAELEDDIANHLQKLNRDVVVKGLEKGVTGKKSRFEIKEIIPQVQLFDLIEPLTPEEDPDEFLGLLAEIPESAEELTEKMIKTAWGEE